MMNPKLVCVFLFSLCVLSSATTVPANPLLFSFNTDWGGATLTTDLSDVLGFADKNLQFGLETLRQGATRFPGGTLSNCWDMRLGASNFINDKNEVCLRQAFIDRANTIRKAPKDILSAKNFANNIGRVSPATKKRREVVWDMNLISVTSEESIDIFYDLLSQLGPNAAERAKYIELGNEFYLARWKMNPTRYVKKAQPLIDVIREELPDSLIAGQLDFNSLVSGRLSGWNKNIRRYRSKFDALTVHGYNLDTNHLKGTNKKYWAATVLNQGAASMYSGGFRARKYFGQGVRLWMTESGLATWQKAWRSTRGIWLKELPGGSILGMSIITRIIGAAVSGSFDIVMSHNMLHTRNNVNNAALIWVQIGNKSSSPARCSVGTAMFAHTSKVMNNGATEWVAGVNASKRFPYKLYRFNSGCQWHLTATKPGGNSGGAAVVTNVCPFDIVAKVPVVGKASSAKITTYLSEWEYTRTGEVDIDFRWRRCPSSSASLPWTIFDDLFKVETKRVQREEFVTFTMPAATVAVIEMN